MKSRFMEMFGDIHENPMGWGTAKFGDVCEILNGYAFKSKLYVDNGIRVIRITNVQKGYIEDAAPQFYPLSYEDELSRYILYAEDILLSLTGNVGRVGLLPENMLPAALNQRVACIRMKKGSSVNKMFLYSMINSDFFEADCIASSQGSAQNNMSTEWLKDYTIIVPPDAMQEEYVSFVRQIDKSKFAVRQALDKTQQLFDSLMQEYFG
ncbi:MAG: restriction endonuclease subunit S [Akkermansiaceae bacterium]|nr:restriction endonuclease subunit S [Akkermansiaceae bacterium]